MEYTIREIRPRDNPGVERVIRTCLTEFGGNREGTAWCDPDLGRFSEVYTGPGRKYWVALDETGAVVGGAGIGPLAGAEGVCELQKMYCLPAARGTGTAHRLMELCLEYARGIYQTCYLETFGNMHAARKFYAKHGFTRLDAPMGGTGHFSCDVWLAKGLNGPLVLPNIEEGTELTIKKAGPQDLDAVTELYGAVCDYLQGKPFNPNWRRDIFPARENAEEYIAAGALYASWEGGTITGAVALNANPSAERTGEEDTLPANTQKDVFYVHLVAVHPAHLRKGTGGKLLDHAAREASAQGGRFLRLYVWTENTPAVRAYESSGFIRLGKEDIGLGEYGLPWFYLYEKRL